MQEVSIEEFRKIDFKVGKVVEAERVPKSEKLLKLMIDIGGDTKQCVASLADPYTLTDIKDRLVIVVTNLRNRKIFGLDSEVMLLAAVDGPDVSLLHPGKPFSPGSKVM